MHYHLILMQYYHALLSESLPFPLCITKRVIEKRLTNPKEEHRFYELHLLETNDYSLAFKKNSPKTNKATT